LFSVYCFCLTVVNGLGAWAKPNVPFVRLAKIIFKKCAVGKNKNTEALALGSAA